MFLYVMTISVYMSRPHFLKRIFFSKIICFKQSNFQPPLAHMFIMDISFTNFVYDCMKLDLISWELSAHANIIKFQRGKISTFVWTCPGTCLMGENIANQCCHCWHLKMTIPTVNQAKKSIIIKCVSCKFERKIQLSFQLDMSFRSSTHLKGMSVMPE